MIPQRRRRPTAWEVSFPGEPSEGDDDERDKEEEWELASEREQVQSSVLKGKRKTNSSRDDRVRCVFLFPPRSPWLTCSWN